MGLSPPIVPPPILIPKKNTDFIIRNIGDSIQARSNLGIWSSLIGDEIVEGEK